MTTVLTKQDNAAIVQAQHKSPLLVLGAKFNIEATKLVDVLRGTVIKPDSKGRPASNEEVAAFCIVANEYGLNPFTREIHAFTSGEKGVVPIVGIDGWAKIVNARQDFDGCEFDEIADDKGGPVAVTCRMYVKDRDHAVSVTERYIECKRNTIPWQQMPWRMLRHKAYMQAARYAFGLAGIYDEDEARDITAQVQAGPVRAIVPMPQLSAAPTPSAEPEPDLEARKPDAKAKARDHAKTEAPKPNAEVAEPADEQETDNAIVGLVEKITYKAGASKRGPWRLCRAVVDGVEVSTFDERMAEAIESACEAGRTVRVPYDVDAAGRRTATDVEIVDATATQDAECGEELPFE